MKNPLPFLTLLFIVLLLSAVDGDAATKTSTGTGNWGTAATWTPSGVPVANDDIKIKTGHTVTVNVNTALVGSLDIESGGTLKGDGTGKTILIGKDRGNDFTNLGTLDAAPPNSATIKLNGNSQWGGNTGTWRLGLLDLNTKTLKFDAGCTAQLQIKGAGAAIISAGTITGQATMIFNYNGSSAQTLSSSANVTYGALWINNSAGVTMGTNLTATRILGDLRIQSGTLNTSVYSITGSTGKTFEVANGATLNNQQTPGTISGFSTQTYGSTSTVNFSGTNQTVSAQGYGNLTFGGSGLKTMPASAMTIAGNFTTSGTHTANAGAALTINGNVTIGSGTTLGGGSFAHPVRGNWSNSGTFSAGTSTVTLNGPGAQTLSGGPFYNLTFNNGSGVTLSSDVSATNILTLTNGNVTTGPSTLTLGTSGAAQGTLLRTSGRILGNFKRWFAGGTTVSNVLWPVGSSSNYRPITLSFTGAPSTGGTLTGSFTSAIPGTLGLPLSDGGTSITNCSVDGYWTLTVGNGLTGGTYALDLTADGFFGVNDFTTLRILKRPNGLSSWTLNGTHAPGTGSNSTPTAHRTGMSGFSQFGIGGAADNPLPIQLAYFNAAVSTTEQNVDLTWGTITETNNFGFTVQRRIGDAGEFLDLPGSFIAGHGTTLEPQEYTWIHENIPSGVFYYRLKQEDLDGTTHFTESVQVIVDPLAGVSGEAPRTFLLGQNFPNPFNPSTTIQFTIQSNAVATLEVFNVLGQVVATLFSGEATAGRYYSVNLNAQNLSNGSYFYKLTTGKNTAIRRMVLLK